MATTIDWSDVEGAARELAGNHRKFECFAWWGRPDDDGGWAVVYVQNRDSGLIDQSNAAQIAQALEPFTEGEDPDVVSERHSHWACGWVEGYRIRVYRDGAVTDAFRRWCELQERMADYPLLSDEDYSRREYEAAIEWIEQVGRRFVKEGAADDWANQVFSWLWDNNPTECENRDDQGACPSRESVKAALAELGLLDDETTPRP